jgi:hexokinase
MTRIPHALLPAEGAVALAGAFIEIDIRFECHGAAMAAALIGLLHAKPPEIGS